jgi:hypothetical protein
MNFITSFSLSIFLLISLQISSSAQTGTDFNAFQSRNAFHLEIGGKAWGGSLNYERRYILRPDLRFSWQVGISKRFGGTWTRDPDIDRDLLIPITLHLMYGKGNHQAEIALGTTLKTINGFSSGNVRYPTIEGGFWMMGVGQAGYRFQLPDYGPVIRVFYSPIYQYLNRHTAGEQSFYHWFGLSVGWSLKHAYVG